MMGDETLALRVCCDLATCTCCQPCHDFLRCSSFVPAFPGTSFRRARGWERCRVVHSVQKKIRWQMLTSGHVNEKRLIICHLSQ